ncbi:uroporphyrinogen-III synthase [Gammaproteobacteria bacterium]|nr:uroporphyrinogen-III synthase [Gammaproteobacteria bacterium]
MKECVLLTRPEGENELLASKLVNSGWNVLIRPMLKIERFYPKTNYLSNLSIFDKIIFVSKNSVRHGMPLIKEKSLSDYHDKIWLAIGRGTATELKKHGVSAEFPIKSDTESLLKLEELKNPRLNRILIIRGEGGRDLLEKTLIQRGAKVFLCEVYRRIGLSYTDLDTIPFGSVLTSNSLGALESLLSNLPDFRKRYNLVVPSKRIAVVATKFAFGSVTNSEGASDEKLYETIMGFRRSADG